MPVSNRIKTLCELLSPTDTFADIGCDHGYCTEYMLASGKCEYAIFSDVSKGSLQKAQILLAKYVDDGKAVGVLGDGFFGVPDSVGEVLIAGMGGSEILSILTDEKHGFLPKTFVFQPMLNADKLRAWLLENGAYITRDFTFKDGKYYDVICGRRLEAGEEKQVYSEMEIEFGKENLATLPDAFLERTRKQLGDIERFLSTDRLQEGSRAELLMRKAKLEAVLATANKTE
jgi:tRNA (adenine22-N1)-methyltransferase